MGLLIFVVLHGQWFEQDYLRCTKNHFSAKISSEIMKNIKSWKNARSGPFFLKSGHLRIYSDIKAIPVWSDMH